MNAVAKSHVANPAPSVLIVDVGWSHTFGLACDLAASGVRVFILGGHSRSALLVPAGVVPVARSLPSDIDDAGLMQAIQQTLEETGADMVLPVAEETLYRIWQQNPAWLAKVVPAIDEANRHLYLSKHHMTAFAAKAGIHVPQTVTLEAYTLEEVEAVVAKLSLPIVVKTQIGVAGSGVHIAHSTQQALSLAHDAQKLGLVAALQEYVDGTSVLVGGVFYRGRAICFAPAVRVEMDPPVTGPSIRVTTTDDPELLDAARRLFRALAFTGIASADFMRARDGRYVHIEVNPRPWGSMGYARASGVDVASYWAKLLRGMDVPGEAVGRSGLDWVKMPDYLRGAALGRFGMFKRALQGVAIRNWSWHSLPVLLWEMRRALGMFLRGKRKAGHH